MQTCALFYNCVVSSLSFLSILSSLFGSEIFPWKVSICDYRTHKNIKKAQKKKKNYIEFKVVQNKNKNK